MADRALSPGGLFDPFGLYLDRLSTVFAVNGIRIVTAQATFGALVSNLRRLKHSPGETHKESHTEDHDEYRQDLAYRRVQRDVPETGRRERSDREVESVNVVGDACFILKTQYVDDRRGYEDEDEQVDCSEDGVFMDAEKPEVAAQIMQEMIRVNQSQTAQDPQHGEVFGQ